MEFKHIVVKLHSISNQIVIFMQYVTHKNNDKYFVSLFNSILNIITDVFNDFQKNHYFHHVISTEILHDCSKPIEIYI